MVSNHEMAKRYKEKSMLMGRDIMSYRCIGWDRVILDEVIDKEDAGMIVIPSFITDVRVNVSTLGNVSGPLKDCIYSKVYIENNGKDRVELDGLCGGMRSESIEIGIKNSEAVVSIAYIFNNCKNLRSVDISELGTKNVKTWGYMFNGCKSLVEIKGLDNLDTSNVETMGFMFSRCANLKGLDISKFNTSKVTDMSGMFSGCTSIRNIELGNIDTSKVNTMYHMFSMCKSLKNIDISNLNTSKVTDMGMLFYDCTSLELVNGIDTIDLSNVENNSYMFNRCYSLVLDRSKIDISKVKNRYNMFYGCKDVKG